MAETVQGRMARKVEEAKTRVKKRRERKGLWEEVNNKFELLKSIEKDDSRDDEEGGGEWIDEDMQDTDVIVGPIPIEKLRISGEAKMVVVDRTASATPARIAEDDEVDVIT
jgi:hypothetical protein